MNNSLPDIGRVTTSQISGLEIRLARGGRSDGIPILLTSPWPESIYAFRGIFPAIKELGPLILVDLPGFGRSRSRPDVMSPEAMGDFVIKLAERLDPRACSCWQERPDRSATERTAARGPLAPLPSHAPRWGASHLGGCCRGVLRSPRPMGPKRVPLGLTEESTCA